MTTKGSVGSKIQDDALVAIGAFAGALSAGATVVVGEATGQPAAAAAVGTFVASMLTGHVAAARQQNLDATLEQLKQDISKLALRMDVERIDHGQFADLYASSINAAMNSHSAEKHRAAAAIMANLLLKPDDPAKLTYNELEHYAKALEAISLGAIEALAAAIGAAGAEARRPPYGTHQLTVRAVRQRMSGPPEPDFVVGLLGELNVFNLVRLDGIPTVGMHDHGNTRVMLSPLGARFAIEFLAERKPATQP